MTIRERHMDTRLGRMAWLEAGAGWPVVLLHGFPLNAGMWRPQLERVPEGSRFIAPDFPGFGRSEPRRVPGNGLGLYAAAVGDLMDALELDDAVIAGLSMGGYVAFEMYRQLPGRFAGLVLADTRAQADTPEGRAGRARLRELLAREGAKGIADQMLPKLLSGAAAPDVVAAVRAMIEGTDPLATEPLVRHAGRRRRRGWHHPCRRRRVDAAGAAARDADGDSRRRPPVEPGAARDLLARARRLPSRALVGMIV
jgi:pimeloyl-ACP methyl ester carboxylesterase